MDTWDRLRVEFAEVRKQWVYLDHAAVAPLPRRCTDAIAGYCYELGSNGDAHYPDYAFGGLMRARQLGAELLHTDPGHVFIVRCTTQGLGLAASGLEADEGDNVVLVEGEFPANIRPWLAQRRRGVEVRFVKMAQGRVPLDALAAAVDDRTRAVSVSYVQFGTGFRIELAKVAELCRRHDALFVVDAIQGLGPFPVDVGRDGVDFLAADSHKWLLGPEGVGLGYASDRALERIHPAVEGWMGLANPFDFSDPEQPLAADAGRYHDGAFNFAGIFGMNGSLELFTERGVDAFTERLLMLTDHLCEGLKGRGFDILSPRDTEQEKSGIVITHRDDVDPAHVATRLKDEGFLVSVRAGGLRLSPHAYTTTDELDALVKALPAP